MMEGGKVIKMEVDYSETVAKKIPEAKVSLDQGKFLLFMM